MIGRPPWFKRIVEPGGSLEGKRVVMRWNASRWICVALLVGTGCATGCQAVAITKVGRASASTFRGPTIQPAGWPSPQPDPLPIGPDAPSGANPSDPEVLIAHADANRRAGVQSVPASREIAARFELIAVGEATSAMTASKAEPSNRVDAPKALDARAVYAAALSDFLRDSSRDRLKLDRKWEDKLGSQGINVRFDPEASTWTPDRFDEFLIASDYKIEGLEHQYKYEGVGVPLLGVRRFRPTELGSREGEAKFLMPRQVYPVTAVLKLRGKGNQGDGIELASLKEELPTSPVAIPPTPSAEYVLELHDPIVERRVEFEGRSEPLAADLTTSLAYHFIHSPLPILQEVGLLDPQWLEKLAGLYMIHPYVPGKIPVIFVHGLRSSPAAWLKVMNEIRGDPNLRERYQVWLFMYPTGTPFPYSASKLRKSLLELRDVVDPDHSDRALERGVLVGHSMGGLISRLMISESGDALWNLVGTRPFDELNATPERKGMLRDMFFFEPHPMITRAVFIATPHRGSELGDQFIGRLADRLIRLPSSLRRTYRALLVENGRDFFTPEVRSGLPTSIDELRPDNRLLKAMNTLPVRPGLEAHSVIGRKDPLDPIEQSTDGIVAYTSSHIDWAVSEKVVKGDHGCQDTPETIEELRRILTLHLDEHSAHQDDPEVRRASAPPLASIAPAGGTKKRQARVQPPIDPGPEAASTQSWQPVRR